MRKLSNSLSLLSLLTRRRTIFFSSSLLYKPNASIAPFNDPFSKTHQFIADKAHFLATSSRTASTLVEKTPQIPSRQRRNMEKSNLEEAFESAETTEEMMKLFSAMENVFEEKELGLAALKIGLKLDREGEDLQALSFASRALKALDSDKNPNLPFAMALQLMGSVNFGLKRFSDSLGYLNRANRVLRRLQEEGGFSDDDVMPVLHAVHLELANVKNAMGRREEALENLRRCLEIKEATFEEGSVELGKANRDLAEAYVAVLNFKEAMEYCLKALEIHEKGLGRNSVEVARDRKLLGIIYSGLEEHENALEQNVLAQRILKNWNLKDDLLRAEIEAANMKIALGRYDEAVGILRNVVHQTDKDSETRALVLLAMAKALCSEEKFADCKRCLEISLGIFEKREKIAPVEVSEALSEIAMLYETMNEFEIGISLLKRALALLEKLPQEQHSEGSVLARIGWLLLLTGKVQQAIPYLESAAERLKESFGPKHFGVASIYNNLGAAYLELDRPQSAAQMFAVAKDIMEVALGPNHADTIEAFQNLSKAYGEMGSYGIAIEFQEQVIDAWESHGASAKDELREARRLLEQLIKKAHSASASERPMKALPLSQTPTPSSKSSQPEVPLHQSRTA